MTARASLRESTAAEHERVDALFSRLDLGCIDDYRLFLTAQAAAHLPVEAALDAAGAAKLLDNWPARRRSHLLGADLAELGLPLPPPAAPPSLDSAASILGAVYVLEGSRLGGAFLKRSVPPDAPKRFLDAAQEPGSWRKLLAKLDEFLYEPEPRGVAIQTAKEVFMRFEAAGRLYLESARA